MAEASCRDPGTIEDEEIKTRDLARMMREGREEEVVGYLASADRNAQQWQRELDECVVMAIQHKQAGIMKHLVEAGAELDQLHGLGYEYLLQYAFSSGDATIIDIFFTHFKGDIVEHVRGSGGGIYLLYSAFESRNLQSVKKAWSLSQELDIGLGEYSYNKSPIHELVDFCSSRFHDTSSITPMLEEILVFFLDKGYNINYTDNVYLNCTPLHLAAEKGNIAGIRALMKHGADLFAQNVFRDYPWTYACYGKNYDAMKELLHRADPDEHREMFESLLHVACRRGAEPAVRYLLDRGVDVNCTDEWNRTPLMNAVQTGHIDLVQCLVNHNLCDVNSHSGAAMRNAWNSLKSVDAILCGQGRVVYYDVHRNNYTSEVEYFRKVLEPVIRCLIQAGASLNLPDENGRTLLMDSHFCNEKYYRDILLQHGADMNAVAGDGCSVLWMAVNYAKRAISFTILMDLLAQNIDVGVSQHQHKFKTPLQAALDQRSHSLCNLLLDADCSLYRMNEYLTNIQEQKLKQDMEKVRARILEMCDEPYSLKAQARLSVLRAIGQGDLRENLHRIHRSRLLPKALVNYLGKAITYNI